MAAINEPEKEVVARAIRDRAFRAESLLYSCVQFGTVQGPPVGSLLRLMSTVYVPRCLQDSSWPDTIKKEFTGQLHRFMASLTETAWDQRGTTTLYIPAEELDVPEAAAKQAAADVQAGKAAVQTAQINLGYATVTAPIAGRVGRAARERRGRALRPLRAARDPDGPRAGHDGLGARGPVRRSAPARSVSIKSRT